MAHTPGPWKYTGQSIIAGDCEFVLRRGVGWTQDDARLIVAAPELLEALKAMQSAMPDCDGDRIMDAKGHFIAKAVGIGAAALLARAAIAKAEGTK